MNGVQVMSKRLSQFGKLLDELDITIAEMAKYLFVDKTTISKWRTGNRKFVKRSPYFQPTVDLMLKRNKELPNHPLNTLFSCEYSETESMKLKNLLADYLAASPCTDFSKPSLAPQKGAPVQEYTVFVDIEGRKQAMDHILTVAEQLPEAGKLKIMEIGQMDWLCRDMHFLKKLIHRLEKLAMGGTQIEIAFSTISHNTAMFRNLIIMLESIRFIKSIKLYIINMDRALSLTPSIYAIDNTCVAVGWESTGAEVPIHTNFYVDFLNVHKYPLMFSNIVKKFGTSVVITDEQEKIKKMLTAIEHIATRKQDFYYFSDYLSVTTMSEHLFMEILKKNNVNATERELCLLYYKVLRQAMIDVSHGYSAAYYCNLQALESALEHDFFVEHELSALINRPIYKTAAQHRQHLKETVGFLECNENIKLVLRMSGCERLRSFTWIKMNLWELSLNTNCTPQEHQVCFLYDTYLVKLAGKICEQTIKEYKISREIQKHNIEILEQLYS